MGPTQLERDRRYLVTARGRFKQQKAKAKRRGVPWLLTFDEWWGLWKTSGKYHLRGSKKHCYVMARNLDSGPYEIGNVQIIKNTTNVRDRNATYHGHTDRRSDADYLPDIEDL